MKFQLDTQEIMSHRPLRRDVRDDDKNWGVGSIQMVPKAQHTLQRKVESMHGLEQVWKLLQVNPRWGKVENSQPSPNIPEGKLSDSA